MPARSSFGTLTFGPVGPSEVSLVVSSSVTAGVVLPSVVVSRLRLTDVLGVCDEVPVVPVPQAAAVKPSVKLSIKAISLRFILFPPRKIDLTSTKKRHLAASKDTDIALVNRSRFS